MWSTFFMAALSVLVISLLSLNSKSTPLYTALWCWHWDPPLPAGSFCKWRRRSGKEKRLPFYVSVSLSMSPAAALTADSSFFQLLSASVRPLAAEIPTEVTCHSLFKAINISSLEPLLLSSGYSNPPSTFCPSFSRHRLIPAVIPRYYYSVPFLFFQPFHTQVTNSSVWRPNAIFIFLTKSWLIHGQKKFFKPLLLGIDSSVLPHSYNVHQSSLDTHWYLPDPTNHWW